MMVRRLPKVDWPIVPLSHLAVVQTGVAKGGKAVRDPIELPYLRVANVQAGSLDLREVKTITIDRRDVRRFSLQVGDVLMTEGGDFDKLGRGTIWRGELDPCLHQNHVFAVRCSRAKLLPEWLSYVAGSPYGRRYFTLCSKQSTNLASINSTQLKAFPIPLPPLKDQRNSSDLLGAIDGHMTTVSRLVRAKRNLQRGLASQLLTGRKRFPDFIRSNECQIGQFGTVPKDWRVVHISEIAEEVKTRGEVEGSVVYSCTKHEGLVPSLEYFGRQVFSRNLNGYKRLQAGDFAYATNHIEEGSLGLLRNGQPPGLVSPMYTVFRPTETVNPEFLFALLKIESYRRVFETRMSASIDRRGSLRWKDFSRIKIGLPTIDEQRRIADTLCLIAVDIRQLERFQELSELQKIALLSTFISGKTVVPS